ncbi:MAG TPA: pentapeptide repeat-containing protein, partial [Ktedonobacterales bacterium]|nr:pentapeptide repeat-containing protein [Ktedonobacterales bacterium]
MGEDTSYLPGESRATRVALAAPGEAWRKEPEIDAARSQFLTERLAIPADPQQGVYPFGGIGLTRADVEWLITHMENTPTAPTPDPATPPVSTVSQVTQPGPMSQAVPYPLYSSNVVPYPFYPPPLAMGTPHQSVRKPDATGLDLRGADLRGVDLTNLPLSGLRGGFTLEEWRVLTPDLREAGAILLEKANLSGAHLEHAILGCASLRGCWLYRTHLEGADLSEAHLENARLYQTHMQGATLYQAHLEGARCFQTELAGANLRRATLDGETALDDISLTDDSHGSALLADVRWGGANLTVFQWDQLIVLGDEVVARSRRTNTGARKLGRVRLLEYEIAERASRQLAVALQAQGLSEAASRFNYRAQMLQREVLRRRGGRYFGAWLFSSLLAVLTGYGYRMGRILIAYVISILTFALLYFWLGVGCQTATACVQSPLWSRALGALVIS